MTAAVGVLRCYNCGLIGHKTQNCPSYGPRFPAPGKTSQDYGEDTQRIANLFAADIVREHEGHSHDGFEYVGDASSRMLETAKWKSKERKQPETERLARQHACPTCGSESPVACRTRDGIRTQAHRARRDLGQATVTGEQDG